MRVVVDYSIVKATYSRFLLNAYKQKHNTNYKGTVALELHKCHYNFGATSCYKREKPKTHLQNAVGKRSLSTVTYPF